MILLVLLFLVNPVLAWMIESDVNPHVGSASTELTINFSLNNTVSDSRLKVYLNHYDPVDNGFDYTMDETIMDYFNIAQSDSPLKISLAGIPEGFYRVCLSLAFNGSYYRDCDKGNQFLLFDDSPVPEPIIGLEVSNPPIIFVNDELVVNITVLNLGMVQWSGEVFASFSNESLVEPVNLSSGDSSTIQLVFHPVVAGLDELLVSAANCTVVNNVFVKDFFNASISDFVIDADYLFLNVSNHGPNADFSVRVLPIKDSFQDISLITNESFTESFDLSGLSGMIIAQLFSGSELIDSRELFVDSKPSSVRVNVGLSDYDDLGMETLLYPFIVVLSIIGLIVLIWKA